MATVRVWNPSRRNGQESPLPEFRRPVGLTRMSEFGRRPYPESESAYSNPSRSSRASGASRHSMSRSASGVYRPTFAIGHEASPEVKENLVRYEIARRGKKNDEVVLNPRKHSKGKASKTAKAVAPRGKRITKAHLDALRDEKRTSKLSKARASKLRSYVEDGNHTGKSRPRKASAGVAKRKSTRKAKATQAKATARKASKRSEVVAKRKKATRSKRRNEGVNVTSVTAANPRKRKAKSSGKAKASKASSKPKAKRKAKRKSVAKTVAKSRSKVSKASSKPRAKAKRSSAKRVGGRKRRNEGVNVTSVTAANPRKRSRRNATRRNIDFFQDKPKAERKSVKREQAVERMVEKLGRMISKQERMEKAKLRRSGNLGKAIAAMEALDTTQYPDGEKGKREQWGTIAAKVLGLSPKSEIDALARQLAGQTGLSPEKIKPLLASWAKTKTRSKGLSERRMKSQIKSGKGTAALIKALAGLVTKKKPKKKKKASSAARKNPGKSKKSKKASAKKSSAKKARKSSSAVKSLRKLVAKQTAVIKALANRVKSGGKKRKTSKAKSSKKHKGSKKRKSSKAKSKTSKKNRKGSKKRRNEGVALTLNPGFDLQSIRESAMSDVTKVGAAIPGFVLMAQLPRLGGSYGSSFGTVGRLVGAVAGGAVGLVLSKLVSDYGAGRLSSVPVAGGALDAVIDRFHNGGKYGAGIGVVREFVLALTAPDSMLRMGLSDDPAPGTEAYRAAMEAKSAAAFDAAEAAVDPADVEQPGSFQTPDEYTGFSNTGSELIGTGSEDCMVPGMNDFAAPGGEFAGPSMADFAAPGMADFAAPGGEFAGPSMADFAAPGGEFAGPSMADFAAPGV